MSNKIYDEIKATITITSPHAVRVQFRDGSQQWIPHSLINNIGSLKLYGYPDEQVIQVERWFIEKYQINGWY